MGKTGFWLRGSKGKLAGTTLYSSRGETIQREIVTPSNPRTDAQMRQRVFFTAASKFYAQAQQNRFPLAFQYKAPNHSAFNAFMKENVKAGLEIFPTKEEVNDPYFPLMNPWILSRGSLASIKAGTSDDQLSYLTLGVKGGVVNEDLYTTWAEFIEANTAIDLQMGDIITFTACYSDAYYSDGEFVEASFPMKWWTRQFIVGGCADNEIQAYLETNGFIGNAIASDFDKSNKYIAIDADDLLEQVRPDIVEFNWNEQSWMIACTHSRKVNGKLQVSNSEFLCSPDAQRLYTWLGYDSHLREAIDSYKPATAGDTLPTEVLEGAATKGVASFVSCIYNGTVHAQGDTIQMITKVNQVRLLIRDQNINEANILADLKSDRGTVLAADEVRVLGAGTKQQAVRITFRVDNWGSLTGDTIKYKGVDMISLTKAS